MKITYLIKQASEGSLESNNPYDDSALIQVSGEEWHNIISMNKKLPAAQRRYFIKDIIDDGNDCDILIIEVTKEEYKVWKRERQITWRNHLLGQQYSFLSIYDKLGDQDEDKVILETLGTDLSAENDFFCKQLFDDLVSSLEAWKPWGRELLQRYMRGERRASTKWLAKFCRVSEQTARQYKRDFERFIKSFLENFSR